MVQFRLVIGAILAMLLCAGTSLAQNKFSGAKMCAACHKGGKGGDSYITWEKSAHANAYKTLLSEASKKVAKEKGLKEAPEKSEAYLKCHVTGGANAKNVEKAFKMEEGVTCEACHGAASAYKMIHATPAGKEKAAKAGMITGKDAAKACTGCHNEESPTFKGFKYDEMWAKIDHKKKTEK